MIKQFIYSILFGIGSLLLHYMLNTYQVEPKFYSQKYLLYHLFNFSALFLILLVITILVNSKYSNKTGLVYMAVSFPKIFVAAGFFLILNKEFGREAKIVELLHFFTLFFTYLIWEVFVLSQVIKNQ